MHRINGGTAIIVRTHEYSASICVAYVTQNRMPFFRYLLDFSTFVDFLFCFLMISRGSHENLHTFSEKFRLCTKNSTEKQACSSHPLSLNGITSASGCASTKCLVVTFNSSSNSTQCHKIRTHFYAAQNVL